ncbi:MAG TPA: hypothetical protein VI299_22525 [Polyangiales bacterium]
MTERCALCALLLFAWGCARKPLDPVSVRAARTGSSAQCARHKLSDDSPYHVALAGPVEDPALRAQLAAVPRDVRRSVLATGLEPLLATMLQERAGHTETPIARLERRQELSTRLSALDSQLSALLFESDCTGDALEDLGHELERREHTRELRLTVASLVVGAVAGVAAAVYDATDREGDGPPIVAGVGAGATALLGVSAFLPNERPVVLRHERNLLAPIARGTDPDHVYPTFVFRLLTLPDDQGGPTPREALLRRWRAELEHAVEPVQRRDAEHLLYGSGGVYSPALMQLRQTMLDQLEAELSSITREVELLERYLLRATSDDESLTAPSASR